MLGSIALAHAISYLIFRKQVAALHEQKAQSYRFFALRDRLIHLATQGKLSEADEVYVQLVEFCNVFSHNTCHLTLPGFIRSSRKPIKDALTRQKIDQFLEELKSKDSEVLDVVDDFYKTFIGVIEENTPFYELIRYMPIKVLPSTFKKTKQAVETAEWAHDEVHGLKVNYMSRGLVVTA